MIKKQYIVKDIYKNQDKDIEEKIILENLINIIKNKTLEEVGEIEEK